MKIELDMRKSVQDNAAIYFEKAKKLKKKIEGMKKTIAEYEVKLEKEVKKEHKKQENEKKQKEKVSRKKEWFEKFRWFMSSGGFLVVGGKDATTNDIIVKKHAEPDDLVLHTESPGSPFVIIKNPDKKKIPKEIRQEAADFCASFSKGWKLGLTALEVYSIKPDQVSKEAKSGEYLGKGSFMIYGKREYFSGKMNLAVGVYKDMAMVAPFEAIKKHSEKFMVLEQGKKKLSDVAKKLVKKLGLEVDEWVRILPQGIDVR